MPQKPKKQPKGKPKTGPPKRKPPVSLPAKPGVTPSRPVQGSKGKRKFSTTGGKRQPRKIERPLSWYWKNARERLEREAEERRQATEEYLAQAAADELARKRAEIEAEERRLAEERAELDRQKVQLEKDREGLSELRDEVSSAFDIQLKSALEYVEEYQRYLREKEARQFNSRDPDDVAHARRIAALTGESERAIFRAMYGYVDELGGIAA